MQCFFCGCIVLVWNPGDDPWIVHAQQFPACPFLIKVKGQDWIKNAESSSPLWEELNHCTAKDDLECCICKYSVMSVQLRPCQHKCFCFECYVTMRLDKDNCPLCRDDILGIVRFSPFAETE